MKLEELLSGLDAAGRKALAREILEGLLSSGETAREAAGLPDILAHTGGAIQTGAAQRTRQARHTAAAALLAAALQEVEQGEAPQRLPAAPETPAAAHGGAAGAGGSPAAQLISAQSGETGGRAQGAQYGLPARPSGSTALSRQETEARRLSDYFQRDGRRYDAPFARY